MILLAGAATALAKPTFQTGDWSGTVSAKGSPEVNFNATANRLRRLDVGSQPVTCSDGRRGAINLPGTVAQRAAKLKKGRFDLRFDGPSAGAQAGSRVSGRLKGNSGSGTLRVILRMNAETGSLDPQGTVKCDSGKRRWKAAPDELFVELP